MAFSRGPLDHIRREIDRKLKAKLERPVDFWLAAEITTGADSLHLHGAIALYPTEINEARRLLQNITKDYDRARALTLKLIDDSRRWGAYSLKDQRWTSRFIPGNLHTETRTLLDRARSLYAHHRDILQRLAAGDVNLPEATETHPAWGTW